MNNPNRVPSRVQLVVIGAGPGGYAAAFRAAELGLEVALIDPEIRPGGVCLYRGCIPSKALLHVSGVIEAARDAAALGVTFAEPRIDIERIRAWKDEVVSKLTGALGQKVKAKNLIYIAGEASFRDERTLHVVTNQGVEADLVFEQAVVATGSSPMMLPGVTPGERIMDSTGALELNVVPRTLLVVGGGYIGLELGSVYATLGSRVSVVEKTGGLLPGCDRDLVSVLTRRLEPMFETLMFTTRVVDLKEQQSRVAATLESKTGGALEKNYDKVLIAVGRRPNTDRLGLENTRVELDQRGFVRVDAQRRSSIGHIFAIGDVAGEPMLAHKATYDANVAAEAAAGKQTVYEPRAIPAVVFTDPEIAWCGLTETAAREAKVNFRTAKLPWRGVGRALTLGRDQGITKLLVDPETDRVLGVGMAGPNAGELIAEGVLAMEMAAVTEDLQRTIHPHPTLSETVYEAAQMLYRQGGHRGSRSEPGSE